MFHFAAMGIVLGVSAGFAPGPLTALVVSETMRGRITSGIRVACAPLVTDLPIIVFSVMILASLVESDTVLAVISLCGAVFIAKMGIENLFMHQVDVEMEVRPGNSLRRGIITNLLSPHPYIFWLTVGSPIMGQAMRDGYLQVAAFLLCFYLMLVGAKMFLAVLVGRSKSFLMGRTHLLIIRVLGAILLFFAALLLAEGLRLILN